MAVTLELGVMIVRVERVPARVCDTCGEPFLDERTCQRLEQLAVRTATVGVGTSVQIFAAA